MGQVLELNDFSGGITDYYLFAPENKMRSCDNLLINQYPQMGKPFTRPGSDFFDLQEAPQIPPGAQRINTCFSHKGDVYVQSAQRLYKYEPASSFGWAPISWPTTNPPFPNAATNNYFSYSHWNYHTLICHDGFDYPRKHYKANDGQGYITEAGLPKFNASSVIMNPSSGSHNWLYKFVYRCNYLVYGGIEFSDVGTPSESILVHGEIANNISNIPSLSNVSGSLYNLLFMYVDIYRTTSNGSVFYHLATINNGTTTYIDSTTDELLETRQTLYTTGGVVANDRPPRCLAVHVKRDTAYYGNVITDSNEHINYRVLQSIPGDIDAVPESFYVDLDDEVVAISSTKSSVVVLCRNSIYRIDGEYDDLGRGGMSADRISDTAGCVSGQSVVQAADGVFWFGLDGVFYTDGFKVVKINSDFNKTYRSYISSGGVIDYTKSSKIQGKYDGSGNRIWWSVKSSIDDEGDPNPDVDSSYILDLNWGISDKSTFTTASGKSYAPTAIEFFNGGMIRCDKRGYVFYHDDQKYTDPRIDVNASPETWSQEPIVYTLETAAKNFGTSATRKFVTQVNVSCESTTNLSCLVVSNNDDGRVIGDLLPIRYRGNIVWGELDAYWGDPVLEWNRKGLIHEKRRVPAKNLRCNFKSIKLTNAKVAIIGSDMLGTVAVNSAVKTVTLDNSAIDWPASSVGYLISFEYDNFSKEYEIISRGDDVLVYSDPTNSSLTFANQKFIIRGIPKGEVLNLMAMSVVYEVSGPTLRTFRTAESGENA